MFPERPSWALGSPWPVQHASRPGILGLVASENSPGQNKERGPFLGDRLTGTKFKSGY